MIITHEQDNVGQRAAEVEEPQRRRRIATNNHCEPFTMNYLLVGCEPFGRPDPISCQLTPV